MSPFRRWPLAVTCLGLGLVGAALTHQRLVGQPVPAPPPLPRELASFSPVVKRVLPAVVSIEGKAKTAAKAKPADPQDTDPGFGSGVLIDPSGVVLTNNHVVRDVDAVEVALADGRKFTARDIRRDPKTDLAIVKLDAAGPLPFLEFADSDAAEVGDRVLAVGAPFGLTGSVTHGIVSGKSRNNLRLNPFEDWLQTDAAVNPGNSGGPLVNLEGKVVGITAAIKTRNGGFSGVGLAVASNLCKTVATQLLKDGVVRRGYLGANVRDLDDALATKLGVKTGAIVTVVTENTPAAKAGVAVGDVLMIVAGQPVRTSRDVQRVVAGLPLGQPAEVSVVRDGKALVLKVVIEEQPAVVRAAAPPPVAGDGAIVPYQSLGLAVSDLTPEMTARLGYPKGTTGALLIAVTRGGPAEQAGLMAGLVVVKVDKTPVASAAAFRQAVAAADRDKGLLLRVLRPSGEVDFAVVKVQ
jgi:serine protease Do